MCSNVLLQLNRIKRNADTFLSSFGPETEETNKLAKNWIRFDL